MNGLLKIIPINSRNAARTEMNRRNKCCKEDGLFHFISGVMDKNRNNSTFFEVKVDNISFFKN